MTLTIERERFDPLISVVLITYNRLEELINCLDLLNHQTENDFEIILVDNGSTDGTAESIERKYPNVRLIRLPYNEGVPGARNIGAINAKGQLLFFLDDDATIEKDTIEKISNRFKEDRSLSVVACNLVDYDSNPIIKRKYDQAYHTADFPGGAVVIKKDLFQQLGYYPRDFFYAAEETDLSLRIYDAGFYIKYCPEIIVYHDASVYKGLSWRRIYYCTRNNMWVAWKYLPFWSLILNNLNNILVHFQSALEHHQFKYYIKGIWHGLIGIPKILAQRKMINKNTQRRIKRLHKSLR
ncbi:MAG: glycosyltransferase family 2 protein [Candidatus Omnitrophica bacterium]|nr:glycosyltransferase family 2 protein [Candidatus Omnitrophota bacterium]